MIFQIYKLVDIVDVVDIGYQMKYLRKNGQ